MTLTRAAVALPRFDDIVATMFHSIPAPGGGTREIQNRNALLWLYAGATGVKTGYTARAGYCIVATAEREGRRLVSVVLGAPGDAFSDAAALLDFGFTAFTDHRFVTTGDPGGIVSLPGGSVAVEVGADLSALVPIASLDAVRRQVVVDPSAAYPPAPGERVARLKITLPGITVGRVPLVVSSVPPPPPIDDGPWWQRAVDVLVSAIGTAVDAVRG